MTTTSTDITRAIVIAAGMGSRLEHFTEDVPKCMVEVGGRSILSYQLEALRAAGVHDIHIVRGYLADRLQVEGATYHENTDYRRNNILHSLFCAEDAIEGGLLTTYSDIVYTAQVVERVVQAPHDITLVVDRQWRRAYEGRHDHPPEQAELVEARDTSVTAVGKAIGPERAVGEFIGLAKFSARGARQLRQRWRDVRARLGDEDPFQNAPQFRRAYLTDLFMELLDHGVAINLVFIDGGWREIDTVEDLGRVRDQWPDA